MTLSPDLRYNKYMLAVEGVIETEGECRVCRQYQLLGNGLCPTCWDREDSEAASKPKIEVAKPEQGSIDGSAEARRRVITQKAMRKYQAKVLANRKYIIIKKCAVPIGVIVRNAGLKANRKIPVEWEGEVYPLTSYHLRKI